MSCNGCRVLRKGCSESCILRPCLQWIDTPEAQGHATVFVAKFFGRAGLMSFISAVPDNQRPALFQSLLYEACGRTVNPVNGAVGLLWTGNWHMCQAAVETVLRGGTLRPMPDLLPGFPAPHADEASEVACTDMCRLRDPNSTSRSNSNKLPKRKCSDVESARCPPADLDLCLTASYLATDAPEKRRPGTPSMNSEESATTTCFESSFADHHHHHHCTSVGGEPKLLKLFT
ncbi:LOB domain-containing protein 37-like [Malania oleifera]|uniref:LOB domain-containing protein 37-like n=1 Tax=Malania oleifera TaxID=397392 RepID=UPI0025AE45B5|nr:LOB domain-containing protein 37-like [Malania oleifera]